VSRPVSRAAIESIVREVLRRHDLVAVDPSREVELIFGSDLSLALKHEMVAVGRKLWERQYVEGNGGNISCRLTDDWVLCTPTLMSKGDLRVEDICLIDFDGRQLAGVRRRSSEVLLHLAIMKAVPAARAVIHCHPPHATAFALAGKVPPDAMLAEHEVFIGPVALVPYETPGTQAFADTVVPYVERHNVVLLANHGLVTWADSLTRAEWCVEVMDNTCRVLILTAQLGVEPTEIPAATVGDLLAMKKQLGLPDARFGEDQPSVADDVRDDHQVRAITDLVMQAMGQAAR
jgi:L-fuculose-phosphate aldolase